MKPNDLPAIIRDHPHFTLWRREDDGTKVPITIRGRRARPQAREDPTGLLTFQEAHNHAILGTAGCDGVGIVLREPGSLLAVIDIDHLTPSVWGDEYKAGKELLRQLRTFCYVERSPSGHGYHAICRAQLPERHKTRHKTFFGSRVEIYTRWRFATLTRDQGRCANPRRVEADQTDRLLPLIQPLLDLGESHESVSLDDIPTVPSNLSDDDVFMEMAGLRAQGSNAASTFFRLHKDGFTAEDDPSDSLHSAVSSLVTVTKDRDQIIRILTTSHGISSYVDANDNPKLDRWIRMQLGTIISRRIATEDRIREERSEIIRDRGYYDQFVLLQSSPTRFYRIDWNIELSIPGLNDSFRHVHTGNRGDPLLGNLLVADPEITRVAGKTWVPRPNTYGPRHDVVEIDGTPYINTWRGFRTMPKPGPVDPWLDLVDHLTSGDQEIAQNIIRRIAYDVQHPDKKCNWSLVIIGTNGAGKDSLLMPISRIFGSSMESVGNDQIKSQYDDEFAGTKIVVINEVRGLTGDSLEKVKKMTAKENSGTVTLNIKGGQKITQQGLWSVYFLTNHHDALAIAPTERRFYVIDCQRVMPQSLRDRYFDPWLEQDGPAHLLDYLQSIDLSDFNPSEMPGRTDAMENMIDDAEHDAIAAIREALDEGGFGVNHGLVNPRVVGQAIRLKTYRHCRDQDVRNVLMQMGWKKIKTRPMRSVKGMVKYRPRGLFAPANSHLHTLTGRHLYDEIGKISAAGDFLEE